MTPVYLLAADHHFFSSQNRIVTQTRELFSPYASTVL
jgi:hypothetical protein